MSTTTKAYRRKVRKTMLDALWHADRAAREADELEADGQHAGAGALRAAARSSRTSARFARTALENLGGDPDR